MKQPAQRVNDRKFKRPSFQFYPGDWLRDSVSGCSLAAQGLWLRIMVIMHDAEPYGHLVENGQPIPDEAVSRRCGCAVNEYRRLLAELDRAGVPSRTDDGAIYSRRMTRDEETRVDWREAKRGQHNKKATSSTLPPEFPDSSSSFPSDFPDSSSQCPPVSSSSSSNTSPPPPTSGANGNGRHDEQLTPDEDVHFNNACLDLQSRKWMTPARRRSIAKMEVAPILAALRARSDWGSLLDAVVPANDKSGWPCMGPSLIVGFQKADAAHKRQGVSANGRNAAVEPNYR